MPELVVKPSPGRDKVMVDGAPPVGTKPGQGPMTVDPSIVQYHFISRLSAVTLNVAVAVGLRQGALEV